MEITTKNNGDEVLVSVEGRIDTTNFNEFEKAMIEVINDSIKNIYLDCSGLNYISSSGLRIFLTIQKKMMATGGKLKLFAMQASIKEIFDISGFSTIFSIYTNESEAREG